MYKFNYYKKYILFDWSLTWFSLMKILLDFERQDGDVSLKRINKKKKKIVK